MNRKIYIVGAGAIGKTLAVCLNNIGRDVILVRGSVDDRPAYTEAITIQLGDKSELNAEIEVTSISNLPELNGVILLTNKSYGNDGLAEKLKGKTNSSPIVLLQNGLGVERPFIDHNFPELYRCVLFATSQNISESRISYKPVADSRIGVVNVLDTKLQPIVELVDSPHFRFKTEDNIQKIAWKKSITNCVFNSVCPLIEVDNGIFHRDENALRIGRAIIEECTSIGRAIGIDLDAKEIEEQLVMISKRSDGQFISTYHDIRNGRMTEIDTLNFEVARIAKELGREQEVKETRLLGELVRMKSDLSRIQHQPA